MRCISYTSAHLPPLLSIRDVPVVTIPNLNLISKVLCFEEGIVEWYYTLKDLIKGYSLEGTWLSVGGGLPVESERWQMS